jgi:hypothetical protein
MALLMVLFENSLRCRFEFELEGASPGISHSLIGHQQQHHIAVAAFQHG